MMNKKHIIPIILAIALMLTNPPTPSYIRHLIVVIISPLYFIVDAPYQFSNWVFEQGKNKETLINQLNQLRHENVTLKSQLQTHHSTLIELQNLKKILGANHILTNQKTLLAEINHINQSRFKKQFIINRGTIDGVKSGQIVISEQGIIGQITTTTSNHSTVLSIIDPTYYMSVKNSRNNIRAITQGVASYTPLLSLNFIPKGADIKIGDLFVSNHNINQKFPKNYPVGKVTHIDNSHPTFMLVKLTPIETIDYLSFVLVLID